MGPMAPLGKAALELQSLFEFVLACGHGNLTPRGGLQCAVPTQQCAAHWFWWGVGVKGTDGEGAKLG